LARDAADADTLVGWAHIIAIIAAMCSIALGVTDGVVLTLVTGVLVKR
jgi:hypothetical protein